MDRAQVQNWDFDKMNKSFELFVFISYYQHIPMHKNATSITNSNSEHQRFMTFAACLHIWVSTFFRFDWFDFDENRFRFLHGSTVWIMNAK